MDKFKFYLNKFKIYITNSAWVLGGIIIRAIITIFIVSQIASHIGTSEFGWYNLGISVFTVLYAVSALGLNPSFLIKYLVKGDYKEERVLGTALYSRLSASFIILLLLAAWIYFFTSEPNYWVLIIASSAIFFQASEVIKSYYQWKLRADVYVTITTVSLVIEALLLLYGLYKGFGLLYFISVYALERLMILIGLLFVFNLEIKLKHLKFDIAFFKTLFLQSWPLLFGALLTALYARFDQILIKYFLTATDLGIYGTAIILTQIWLIIPSLIIPVIYPKIAQLKNNSDPTKYHQLILFLYGLLNYSAIIIVLFILIFGEWIILSLYGADYIDSVYLLYILIFNMLILFQSHLTSSVMIIENEEKYLLKIKVVSVIVNISLNIALLATMGVKFAAYSLIIASVISWIVMALFNKKMTQLLVLNLKSFLAPLYLKQLLK
ncbi:MAG: oligosaccharide flippase family protein [Bacteroidia bacterium]|nr:oligosaccharide flippase family protein [Bacteroidia bacterium]NND53002.1 oligosaccharide flippase family protein [Flavobacteriaceae bacterium]